MSTSADDLDPTNDPEVPGHEKGKKPPFPPMYEGDPCTGHHRTCAVRVTAGPCTCGMWELEPPRPPETPDSPVGRIAHMPLAADFLHRLLNLPEDVHIIDVTWENVFDADLGNVLLALEAFSDDEFPARRVTARLHETWNIVTVKSEIVFDGWESID